MSKKMMLLALSVVGAALIALPAVASATPAHTTVTGPISFSDNGTQVLEDDGGARVECHGGVTGTGNLTTTTTGTATLSFHGCTAENGLVSCNSSGAPSGTIVTTALTTHLVMLAGGPGLLITSNNGHFATFNCSIFVKKEVTGNGVLGTITSPACNGESTTATVSFAQGATGSQNHTTYTGTTYQLKSNGTNAGQIGTGTITLPAKSKLVCT